jgi:hypothetical protein
MAVSDVLLKPAFVSPYLDGPDATKLQPSAWNAARLFSGGVDGQILTRDALSPTGGTWSALPAGTFAALTGKPTTLAGYGITDGVLTSDARLSDARVPLAHTQAFSTITGLPSTLAGYGIPAVTKADVGLSAVENTALSTWAGSANVVTIGPLTTLKVGGVTAPSGVEGYFASTSASDPRGLMSAQYSTDTTAARIHLRKGRGTEAAPTTIVTGDVLGRVRFSGYDSANYLQMASIDVVSTGTIAATRVPTYMTFSVATDAAPSVLTEVLRLSPLYGAGAMAGILRIPISSNGNANFLQVTNTDHGAVGAYNFTISSTANPGNGARDDHVLVVGYNCVPGGGQAITSEPSFAWRIEDFYQPAATAYLEGHWEYFDQAGASFRPIAIRINRAAAGSYVTDSQTSLMASQLSYLAMDGTQSVKFIKNELQLLNTCCLNNYVNNVQGLKQAKVSGSLRSLIYINAADVVVLGDTTGVLDIQWTQPLVALGGGATPTLGTIGATGPATAAQHKWLRVMDSAGAACWIPVWK